MKTIWNKKGIFLAILWFIPVIIIQLIIVRYFDMGAWAGGFSGFIVGAIYGSKVQDIFKIYRFEDDH